MATTIVNPGVIAIGERIVGDLDQLRYNEIRQKSSHNAFSNLKIPIPAQIRDLGFRSVEVDLHNGKGADFPNNWKIYHVDAPILDRTSVDNLIQFVQEMKQLHDRLMAEQGGHEVITVFVDLHDRFDQPGGTNHTPQRLDQILRMLDSLIYTPGDFLRGEKTLIGAIRSKGWPTLAEMRNKFLFVLTGTNFNRFHDANEILPRYLNSNPLASLAAFVAPDFDNDTEASIGTVDNVVFHNFSWGNRLLALRAYVMNMVSRVFTTELLEPIDLNNQQDWDRARRCLAHHVGSNMVDENAFPWTKIQNANGWPFQMMSDVFVMNGFFLKETPVTVV